MDRAQSETCIMVHLKTDITYIHDDECLLTLHRGFPFGGDEKSNRSSTRHSSCRFQVKTN